MAEQRILVPKALDPKIIIFFETLVSNFQFLNAAFRYFGSDQGISINSPDSELFKSNGGSMITSVSANTSTNISMAFRRGANGQDSAALDTITINSGNQGTALTAEHVIGIDKLIDQHFRTGIPGSAALYGDPSAFREVIQSHQQIITKLEETTATVGRQLAEERGKLEADYESRKRKEEERIQALKSRLDTEYRAKLDVLEEREKRLNDRDNMHERRAIRADLKKRLQEHAKQFSLTDKTRQMRSAIHVTVWIWILALSGAAIWLSSFLDPKSLNYTIVAKSGLLTIATLGIVTWYIRWMNRWFEQHADAEFNLKQFELDVDRASWVVETAMEWRASQHGVIPSHLLESISRNLFNRREREYDEEMHPADYLASALLGKASHVKLALAGNEVEFDRKAIKSTQKET